MQSPPSKNNKIILVSIGNKSSAKRTDLLNTSSKRAQSNERRLQTLEPETTTVATTTNQSGLNSNNAFGKQLFQSPTSAMGQSNNQKRKLFSNLNNCTPKSPASIYATITGPNTTTASVANNNSSSSRHSKITKLNNFFEQRKNNGAESAKKNRITNENMIENINRQKYQISTDMEEEFPIYHQQQQQQHHYNGQMGSLSPNNQYLELMNRNDNVEAEFNKTIKEFRKQIKQNQTNQLSNNSQQQKLSFPPVPDSTYPTTPQPHNQDSHETPNIPTPIDKQQHTQQQNSGLNSFVTRINKGELIGGNRSGYNNNSINHGGLGNNLSMNSPTNNSTNYQLNNSQQNQSNLFYQHQNQQYLSSLVPINNQTSNSNNSQIVNMNKLFSSNEKKTNKEVILMMNNKFKKADSFKIPRSKQEQSSSQPHQEQTVVGGSVRSSLSKPFSKKSGRQTTSSVRTSSSMKSKSKKATPLQISLDHSLNQQTLNTSSLQQQGEKPQHSRQLTNTTNENTAIEIEDSNPIPSEHPPANTQPYLKSINLDDIFVHKQKNPIKHFHYYNIPMTNALKNRTSSDQYFDQLFKEHFIQSFHSLNFCKNIKPVPHHILQQKKINLPIHQHNSGKKTIVFDLDETLIHCNENTDIPSDVIVPIKFPNNDVIDAGINIRPHAKECLEELSKHFEIIVFTASHGCYAIKVLQHLDPEEKYISHKLFRESCVQTEEGVHIKDMRIFQNRNIKDIVLVDNAAYSFGFQIENGIPIVPYYDNKNDQELKHLTQFLLNNILECQDVREVNKQYFKMHLHQNSDKLEHAAKKIYNI